MPHKLVWNTTGDILHLSLYNQITLDEMVIINEQIIGMLNRLDQKVILLMEVSTLNAGYTTVDQLRKTQEYIHHSKLDSLVIISRNKLNRLITMMAFNLGRVPFFQFDTEEKASGHVKRRGFSGSILANI